MSIIQTIKNLLKDNTDQNIRPYAGSKKATPAKPLTFVTEDGKQHRLHAVLIHPGYGTEYDQEVLRTSGINFCENRLVTECSVGNFQSTIRVVGFDESLNSVHFEFQDDDGKFVDIYSKPTFQVMPY